MSLRDSPGTWRTSSYSKDGENCVEVKADSDAVYIRDTKDREGGTFRLTPDAWSALIEKIGKE